MFGLCTKLVLGQDEISGLETIVWERHYGNTCHWSVTKGLSIFNARRSTCFSDSVLCLGKTFKNSQSNEAWEQKIGMVQIFFKSGIYFRDSIRCSSSKKSNVYSGERPENFKGRILFMSMFNDISCGTKDNVTEFLANAKIVSLYWKRKWSFIGPDSEWYLIKEDSPQGIWDKIAERNLLKVDVQFSAQPMWKRLRLFFA